VVAQLAVLPPLLLRRVLEVVSSRGHTRRVREHGLRPQESAPRIHAHTGSGQGPGGQVGCQYTPVEPRGVSGGCPAPPGAVVAGGKYTSSFSSPPTLPREPPAGQCVNWTPVPMVGPRLAAPRKILQTNKDNFQPKTHRPACAVFRARTPDPPGSIPILNFFKNSSPAQSRVRWTGPVQDRSSPGKPTA
jgi:hypothetical protein